MPCSAVTLSLATITAIVAVALLAIAFSTDNWVHIDVKRAQIHQVSSTVTTKSNLVCFMELAANSGYCICSLLGLCVVNQSAHSLVLGLRMHGALPPSP
jgi:hypothetical protein